MASFADYGTCPDDREIDDRREIDRRRDDRREIDADLHSVVIIIHQE